MNLGPCTRPLQPRPSHLPSRRRLGSTLQAGERKLLDTLVGVYPKGIERTALAHRTGFEPTGGTYGTYLSVLRRDGLMEEHAGKLRASPTLFLGGGQSSRHHK